MSQKTVTSDRCSQMNWMSISNDKAVRAWVCIGREMSAIPYLSINCDLYSTVTVIVSRLSRLTFHYFTLQLSTLKSSGHYMYH